MSPIPGLVTTINQLSTQQGKGSLEDGTGRHGVAGASLVLDSLDASLVVHLCITKKHIITMADVMLGDKLMKGIKNITREVEKNPTMSAFERSFFRLPMHTDQA